MEEQNHTTASRIYERRKIAKKTGDVFSAGEDNVVRELPLTIMLNGEEFATLVCSPGYEKELAVGFMAGEGIIEKPENIKDLYFKEKQRVLWIETGAFLPRTEGFLQRNFTSCCGRGRPALYFNNDAEQLRPVVSHTVYSAAQIDSVFEKFITSSEAFHMTGGVHTAGLCIFDDILVQFDDIGRHNALDRIMGHIFLNSIDTSDTAVLLSGRISSEMLVKTARIGAPLVISKSAPTTLALDLADDLGITVVGFTRGHNCNVYTHPERIADLREGIW